MRINFPKATALFVLILSWLIFSTTPASSQPRLTQKTINEWTDNFFYSANPQLSRRKIGSNETEYIREWNAIQRIVPDILVYQSSCSGYLMWMINSYDGEDARDRRLFLVSEDLNKVADAIFYARHPELGYRRIRRGETRLANEWSRIRTSVSRLHPCHY
ncbi:MAG: hypothetical protein F6J93_15135 [Oscillatoria sp. SIO1A7]|nr:hypothetical protein [Oscillatoria sp. SIO1A7]